MSPRLELSTLTMGEYQRSLDTQLPTSSMVEDHVITPEFGRNDRQTIGPEIGQELDLQFTSHIAACSPRHRFTDLNLQMEPSQSTRQNTARMLEMDLTDIDIELRSPTISTIGGNITIIKEPDLCNR